MRATYRIEDLFGTRSGIAVLRVLHGVRVPLNASQIAARIGLTRPAVASALRQLSHMGIVHSSPAGRATVHWLVRDNVYVQSLVAPLFATEAALPDALLADLRERFCCTAESVVLFGSYARGDQTDESDVDVALVATDAGSRGELERMAADSSPEFRERFGASLSVLTYTREEAAALAASSPRLAESIRRDGITVCGSSPLEW